MTNDPLSKVLQVPEGKARLQVLELGTGCGIVGISIAQGVPKADIILTDLPEAEEIVQKNIYQATLAKDSTLRFHTLDWDDQISKDLNNWSDCPHCTELDLIIAADCTYNPDSR
jgi:methylase of polypeptide subunit release factors